MSTIAMPLPILAGYPPDDTAGSASADLTIQVTSDATDPQPRWPELAFDKDTDEHWYWAFMMPSNYASDPVLRVFWTANATAGGVTWGAHVLAITAGDSASIRAEAFDSANVVDDDAPGTEYYPLYADISLSNANSVVAGDHVVLALFRDVSDEDDDMDADAIVLDCELRFTST